MKISLAVRKADSGRLTFTVEPDRQKRASIDGREQNTKVDLGMALGAGIGAALNNIAMGARMGLVVGVSIGMAIGTGLSPRKKC